ncbi:hypothetical protein TRVA0_050S00188 [Trichomonascus vanleenenianus]|uniref:uncharacterized protein n=1 Tax=Trichomonascus vanleenenianus TaxID=2268995 RepID=UPI003ECAE202
MSSNGSYGYVHTRTPSSAGSYVSRPSSVSPQFATQDLFWGSTASIRDRFVASRGFEDDLEFCPALHRHGTNSSSVSSSPSTTHASLDEHHRHEELPKVTSYAKLKRVIEIVDPSTGLRVGS